MYIKCNHRSLIIGRKKFLEYLKNDFSQLHVLEHFWWFFEYLKLEKPFD